jgi:DNA polymerase
LKETETLWKVVGSFGVSEVALPSVKSPALPDQEALPLPADALEALRKETEGCARCRLSEGRNRLVFGDGNPWSGILFVGEGPGANEDQQGLPFVGRAGELLDRILGAIFLDRGSVYIANVVKCRPPGNRVPAPDEVESCLPLLKRQMDIMKPEIIVALGASAASALLDTRQSIGSLRGALHSYGDAVVMVTYHPAALLRSPALKRPVWEDMKKLAALMKEKGLPRSPHGS